MGGIIIKKSFVIGIFMFFSLLIFNSDSAFADMGPKPSVVINIEGLQNEKYYITLLSSVEEYGPYSVSSIRSKKDQYENNNEALIVWQKFVNYKDKDGYYFLQYFGEKNDKSTFSWTYYPPEKFKVLIYFPDHDYFVNSEEILERYAFDSYFKVKLSGNIENGTLKINLHKNYNHFDEIFSLIVRILLTILVELAIAILFAFRKKKLITFICIVNIITQTLLNIFLNISNYKYGGLVFTFNYVWMEVLIVFIEAYLYKVGFRKMGYDTKKYTTIAYSVVANTLSFAVGLYLSFIIPGVF